MPEIAKAKHIQDRLEDTQKTLLDYHRDLLVEKIACEQNGDKEYADACQDAAFQVTSAIDHLVNARDELDRVSR